MSTSLLGSLEAIRRKNRLVYYGVFGFAAMAILFFVLR